MLSAHERHLDRIPLRPAGQAGGLEGDHGSQAAGDGRIPPELEAALRLSGLILRGGFSFAPGEAAPPGPSGAPARSVLLVGNAGATYWRHFQAWRATQPRDLADPLDSWSRDVIGAVAAELGARAISPSDRPFLPFQQWAMRAEGLKPSPLGILMHPEYGLWHAYRGALLFEVELRIPAPAAPMHLCSACAEKPCLKACPVAAYSEVGFDHAGCRTHVRGAVGSASCGAGGCLDRKACPHGAAYSYPADVQAFHMASFAPAAPVAGQS